MFSITKNSDHFILKFEGTSFDDNAIKQGYNLIFEHTRYQHFEYAICDLTQVERLNLSREKMELMSASMLHIFNKNEQFQLYDVVPHKSVKQELSCCQEFLAQAGFKNLKIVETVQEISELRKQ